MDGMTIWSGDMRLKEEEWIGTVGFPISLTILANALIVLPSK